VTSPSLPSVSVVIPTRDRPELMRAAVRAALTQEYDGPIEVVVVFDQSTPDQGLLTELADVQDGPRRSLRLEQNTRPAGLAGARNHGIEAASGELLGFCDDDDYWLPTKLSRQVQVLRDHPDTSIVCAGITVEYGDERFDRLSPLTVVRFEDLLRDRLTELHPSTFLMRRADLAETGFGLVDEAVPGSYGEDYEFLLRASRSGLVRAVPEPLTVVRWHKNSFFRRWDTIAVGLTWLLHRYPEFETVPKGSARVRGQIAFAHAALGERRAAVSWAWGTMRRNPFEPRWALALGVASRAVSADTVMAKLHARGKGI
jgi:glycosyltransferase involved in cell wall biosynthesis